MNKQFDSSNELLFVFRSAILFQLFFVLIFTVYHDLIIISDPFFRYPPPEQIDYFWTTYETADLPYSLPVGIVGIFVLYIAYFTFPLSIFRIVKKHSRIIGKKRCCLIIVSCLVACIILYLPCRLNANPYYFYMSFIIPEILSVTYIVFFLLMKRSIKSKEPNPKDSDKG